MEGRDGVRLAPCAGGAGMIGLAATRTPARRCRRARWRTGRIGGGRFGRVLAGLGQTLFEFQRPRGERGDLEQQGRDQRPHPGRGRLPIRRRNTVWRRQQIVHGGSMPERGRVVKWP